MELVKACEAGIAVDPNDGQRILPIKDASPRSGRKHKPGAPAPGKDYKYKFRARNGGRQHVMQRAVARYHGLDVLNDHMILGLAPQALCFRPLRGLDS